MTIITKLFSGFGDAPLIEQAEADSKEMLEKARRIFRQASDCLRYEAPPYSLKDVYEVDKRINSLERSIRRKIFTHLSVNQPVEINSALILASTVHDIERIGDYSKNIYELAGKYPEKLNFGQFEAKVQLIENIIQVNFDSYFNTVNNPSDKELESILEELGLCNKNIDHIIDAFLTDPDSTGFDKKKLMVSVMYLRFLKRVSSHLRNISSSLVNSFDRIGFVKKPTTSTINGLDLLPPSDL